MGCCHSNQQLSNRLNDINISNPKTTESPNIPYDNNMKREEKRAVGWRQEGKKFYSQLHYFCPNLKMCSTFLVSTTLDYNLIFWNIFFEKLAEIEGHSSHISYDSSLDKYHLATCSEKEIKIWDAEGLTLEKSWRIAIDDSLVRGLRKHNGKLALTGLDHSIEVWDWRKGEKEGELRGHKGEIKNIVEIGNGYILSVSVDQAAYVWDLGKREIMYSLTLGDPIFDGIEFAPGIITLITDSIHIWKYTTKEAPELLYEGREIICLKRLGKYLAVEGKESYESDTYCINLWNLDKHKLKRTYMQKNATAFSEMMVLCPQYLIISAYPYIILLDAKDFSCIRKQKCDSYPWTSLFR